MRVVKLSRQFLWFACSLFVLFSVSISLASAEGIESRGGKIRAALVYYLVKFVSWPKETTTDSSLEVCAIGQNELNATLQGALNGKRLHGQPIRFRSIVSYEKLLQPCKVNIFIDDSLSLVKSPLFLNSKSLNVCISKELEWGQCMVQIFDRDNRAKIGIDLRLTSKAGFVVSSELLEVAEVKSE